ncbi:hypothetical protein G7084_00220 [Weissella coleopterorum]|uniref:Uncharacterized protein n=1 Tax=Weissella coleopterorum TaxID=2714949 RepID=A0A6G8AXV2_9LACO|nr:hypothetical protein [Weissella coleopterorum]QIL49884.1 hypothetical protein G7084_00220 [Weissella coleopterorum]
MDSRDIEIEKRILKTNHHIISNMLEKLELDIALNIDDPKESSIANGMLNSLTVTKGYLLEQLNHLKKV